MPHEQGAWVLRFVPHGAETGETAASPRVGACRLRRFGGWGRWRDACRPPKRDSQGMDPLGGCGQSPPFSPRDSRGKTLPRERRAKGFAFPGAPTKPPLMRKALVELLFPRYTYIRRATLQRFCPQGKQRRIRTHAAPPCPPGQGSVISPPRAHAERDKRFVERKKRSAS